ncbi:hypothetical protein [Campylobacter portucalensis]|nr:hypothetical protein [Campylobacter portucalensis]
MKKDICDRKFKRCKINKSSKSKSFGYISNLDEYESVKYDMIS